MCGIVGYVGKKCSLPFLIEGLNRLEYRGYDSAGIAFLNGNGIEIYRAKGKIRDLKEILPHPFPEARIGLGHTRWATHGAPSEINAHPHTAVGVTVVHNGIIENYRELKAALVSEGRRFLSDTDTEVIPQMISKYIAGGMTLRDAIKEALNHLKGSFAVGIISELVPDSLFAVRKGSPLVIGIGEGEFFFASDIPAILPYTRKFIFMEDGQLCTLHESGIELENVGPDNRTVSWKNAVVEVDWTPSMAEKDGHKHFMLKEIHEQPLAVMTTLGEWIEDPQKLLSDFDIQIKPAIDLKRLHIVACGTSYHAALVGRYLIEHLARIPVEVEIASEYRYKEPILEKDILFISITQSGETADTLAAQREASKRGSGTLTICNVVGSTASREADHVLYTRAGPEIGVASTKAFTAQLSALALLAIALGIKRGRLTVGEASSLKSQLLKLPALLEKALKSETQVRKVAETVVNATGFLFLGRGINYPTALEGALKLKEISYIHAEGYPAGEMKHGPIALIDKGKPVIAIVPVDDLYEKMLSNIEEVKARGARVIAITDEVSCLRDKADDIIEVPSTHPVLSPFVNVVPLQLLAYYIAVLKGCDVDQPRNLAKSVTVE